MGSIAATEPSWVRRGWFRTSARAEIAAPTSQVWALLADPACWTEWYPDFTTFDTPDIAVGATFSGKDWVFPYVGEVNEFVPEKRIGMTHTASALSVLTRRYAELIEIEPGDARDRCTVIHSGRYLPSSLGWILAPFGLGQAMATMWFHFRSSTRSLTSLAENA